MNAKNKPNHFPKLPKDIWTLILTAAVAVLHIVIDYIEKDTC